MIDIQQIISERETYSVELKSAKGGWELPYLETIFENERIGADRGWLLENK